MIKNIVFDVGFVLIGYTWKEDFKKFGYDDEGVSRLAQFLFGGEIAQISGSMWEKYDYGDVTHDQIRASCLERYPDDREVLGWFFDHPDAWYTVLHDMADLILPVKEKGYGVYLLSNYPELLWKVHVVSQPFYKWIDGETVSCTEHCGKPDQVFFRRLLEKYSLDPEECLFVDDRKENTEAARKLGFHTLTIDDPSKRREAVDILNTMPVL